MSRNCTKTDKQIPLFIPDILELRRINSELRTELLRQAHHKMKLKKLVISMANCGNCYTIKELCPGCKRNPENADNGLPDNWRYKK
jgi:hypothetical protein